MTDLLDLDAVEKKIGEEYRRALLALQTLKRYLGEGESGSSGHTPPLVINRENVLNRPEDFFIDDVGDSESPTIIDKVEEIMLNDPHKKWSVPSMVAHLKSLKFPLQAKKPEATMGLIFAKLTRKRKTIVRVRKGSGRTPNLFRGIPREHRQDASDSDQNERAAS
jgi:hypothetical protein